MLPNWIKEKDNYKPVKSSNRFIRKTIKIFAGIISRIRIQKGQNLKFKVPTLIKLFVVIALILTISICKNKLILILIAAALFSILCCLPAKIIWNVLKTSTFATLFTAILFLPSMIINPEGIENNIIVIFKVLFSVLLVCMFNQTTQWNKITFSLKKLHIPSIFIFTLDITIKYIVVFGNRILNMLNSLELRSVGKNNKTYNSIGGIMGTTFISGMKFNQQIYEAMSCRCFTDDYGAI